jgi:hypothetical protein
MPLPCRRGLIFPYKYGCTITAAPQLQRLPEMELTRCSRSADNCHFADELEFQGAGMISRVVNISPVFGCL